MSQLEVFHWDISHLWCDIPKLKLASTDIRYQILLLYSLKKISYAKPKVNTQRLWDYLFYDYKNWVPQSIHLLDQRFSVISPLKLIANLKGLHLDRM